MSDQKGSVLPGVIWLATMWAIGARAPLPYSDYAFLGSIALMGVWYLAMSLFWRACGRLGATTAYSLLGLFALWALLFLHFVSTPLILALLLVWSVAIPAVMVASGVRALYEAFPRCQHLLMVLSRCTVASYILAGPAIAWIYAGSIWQALADIVFNLFLVICPLLIGWRFGAPAADSELDAKFGQERDYQLLGVSDDR